MAAWWLAAACAPQSGPAVPITIVASTGPFDSIEQAADAEARVNWWNANFRDDDACTESYAATELRRFLPACLGVPPEKVRLATTLPATGDAIVLGSRTSNPLIAARVHGAVPPPDGFQVELEHRGGRRVVVIEGGDRAGTLHGAYELLEQLGVRFYGLGDTGTVVPARPASWPRRLSLRDQPAFTTRGFWAWEPRGNRDFLLWMGRNRMNLWTAADTLFVPLMKKLGLRLTGGGHTIQAEFLDPARYFRAHPEWFGLHDGRRSPEVHGESGDNFCTSNAEARRELSSNLVRALATGSLRHVDDLQLWMLDQGRWCECQACRAQGSPTDRWLDVATEVAKAIGAARRDGHLGRRVTVDAPAYLETLAPPSRPHAASVSDLRVTFYPYFRCYAHGLRDPSCTEINHRIAAAQQGWGTVDPKSPRLSSVCEYYNVATFKSFPFVAPQVMAADIAAYRQAGVSHFMYMHAPTSRWGTWTLNHALVARLLWDPWADVDSLVADFCRREYPAAGGRMRAFYRHLETATGNLVALQHCAGVHGSSGAGGRLAQEHLALFPLRHLQERSTPEGPNHAASLDEIDQAVRAARLDIDAALAGGHDPVERARVHDVERRFFYGEAVLSFYSALIRTAAADRARDGNSARRWFARAADAAGRLRAVHDLVQVAASHANASDGLEASGVRATYEYFGRRYGGGARESP